MNAPNDDTTPSRSGLRRVFPAPLEYPHLRAWAGARIGGGSVLVGLSAVTLVRGKFTGKAYGWAAFFLALAALSLSAGFWELNTARSEDPPT